MLVYFLAQLRLYSRWIFVHWPLIGGLLNLVRQEGYCVGCCFPLCHTIWTAHASGLSVPSSSLSSTNFIAMQVLQKLQGRWSHIALLWSHTYLPVDPFPPADNIWAMLIAWKIIRTVLCCILYHSCALSKQFLV